MEIKVANLTEEQQEKVKEIESELGCILIAYEG